MPVKYTIANRASGDVLSYSVSALGQSNAADLAKYSSYAQIERLVRSRTIYPRFRIYVLNSDETVKYELPQKDILLGGSYSENYQNGQRRSLSLTLNNESGDYTPSINGLWVNTKFLFEVGMQVPDSNLIVWFSKGVFVITDISPSRTAEKKTVSLSLSDKFNFLEGASGVLSSSYTIPVGTVIEDAIQDILYYNNGDGNVLDPKPMIYHSSFKGKTTQQTISESEGSSWGSVILKLADMLSAEVFYNTDGQLTLVPLVEVSNDGDKPVLYNFAANEGDFQDSDFSYDFSSVINRVIVIGANVNGASCDAIAVNDDPSSPLCYQRIGYRTADPISDSNITSKILAQERADYELRKQLIAKTTISNSVYFNPLLTVNNLVTITDDFYGLVRERFLLQSISFSLNYDGLMDITSSNIRNLPFTNG